MKTKSLFIIAFLSISIYVNAQIKIYNDGKVYIGGTITTPNSRLSIGGAGNNLFSTYSFNSTNNANGANAIRAEINAPTIAGITQYSIVGSISPGNTSTSVGVCGAAYRSTAGGQSQAIGVYGYAGNAQDGGNFGVFGKIIGDRFGAGIVGNDGSSGMPYTTDRYAGYFWGNVKITNGNSNAILWINNSVFSSDQRLKKNISVLTNTYEKIAQLNAVEYQYKTGKELIADGVIAKPDSLKDDDSDNENIDKIHYGFIAQDVQKIFPELVYTGKDGILGIDYIGLIPLMLEAIKQQEEKIILLQSDICYCCEKNEKSSMRTTNINDKYENNDVAILYQNTPNPFTNETQIRCYIPKDASAADVYIYNMQGTQIKKTQIAGKGDEIITIKGYDLQAGMYMYTLIIDGKEIDTKKMILTE